MESIFWGGLTRIGQSAVEASVTLFVGLLVAAILRRMLGAAGVRRMFGGDGWSGLLRAWALGTLLPVCSLGVLPVAAEMRRCGLRTSTILAFLLSAPHLNPLSLLYGLTLSAPSVIITFALASLTLAVLGGAMWDWFFEPKQPHRQTGDEPMPTPGVGRLLAVFVNAARDSVSPLMGFVVFGVLATGLLAAAIPHGYLSTTMRHDDVRSPLLMAVLALPAYAGPLQGMMKIGAMFEHGNSVGASFVLFELGIGLNLGLVAWEMRSFGSGKIAIWLLLIIVATVGLGYAAEKPLYFAYEEASHTHAFDDWTNPFPENVGDARLTLAKVAEKVEILEPVALVGLALLLLTGLTLRWVDPQGRLDAWLTRPAAEDKPRSRWDVVVPGPVLGVVALIGLVAFSIVALFIYYPPPEQVIAEMGRVRAEVFSAVKSRNKEEGIRQLELWDLLTRKLQVGVFLRTGKLDPEDAKLAEQLRERLEDVRDALLAGDLQDADDKLRGIEQAYGPCKRAFLPSLRESVPEARSGANEER